MTTITSSLRCPGCGAWGCPIPGMGGRARRDFGALPRLESGGRAAGAVQPGQPRCERELIPAIEPLGTSMAAWSPLGGGVLSGRYSDTVARLEADTAFETGFRHDFIADMQSFVFGDVAGQVDE
jgi:hypothetical protein